jgi:tetratricopeptide (TPR) repeat protein
MIRNALGEDIFVGDILSAEPPNAEDVAAVPTLASSSSSQSADRLLDRWITAAQEDVRRYPESNKPLVDLARSFLHAGRTNDADDALSRALALEPLDYAGLTVLAAVALTMHDLVRARTTFQTIYERWAEDAGAILGLAQVAVLSNDSAGAKHYCSLAIAASPNRLDARLRVGAIFIRLNDLHAAIHHLKVAARLDPHSAPAFYSLGVAYAIRGDRRRAQRALEACLMLAPRAGDAVKVLSRLILSGSSVEGVIDLLRTRLEEAPSDHSARDLLAQAYMRNLDFLAARKQLITALSAVSSDPEASDTMFARITNNLGVCYERQGELTHACKFYRRAVERDPNGGPIPFQNLVHARIREWDLSDAQRILDDALARYPDDPKLNSLQGIWLYCSDDLVGTVRYLTRAVAKVGAVQHSFEVLASALTDEHEFVRAIAVLRSAEDRWGRDASLANTLAYTLLMSGDVASAEEVLQRRYDGEERSVSMVATRGLLQLRKGDIPGGIEGYLAAAELAAQQGDRDLRSRALQKMHVETARTYLSLGRLDEAADEVHRGRQLKTRGLSFRRELDEVAEALGLG